MKANERYHSKEGSIGEGKLGNSSHASASATAVEGVRGTTGFNEVVTIKLDLGFDIS